MHTVIFKALIGSRNYNLAIPGSDADYLLFVIPTFNELYQSSWASRSLAGDESDVTLYDIRKVPSIFWKSSPNALESLFSVETKVFLAGGEEINEILDKRDEIARINPSRLYLACRDMATRKRRNMLMDSPARHASIKRYGFDVKSACQAARNFDFILRFWESGLDFGQAIHYAEKDPMRERLIAIKSGKFSFEECEEWLSEMEEQVAAIEGEFLGMAPNQRLCDWLDAQAKAIFLRGLAKMGQGPC